MEALAETDRLKTELLANVSHQLRTPLGAIVGMSSALLETARIDVDEFVVEVINIFFDCTDGDGGGDPGAVWRNYPASRRKWCSRSGRAVPVSICAVHD